MTWKVIGCKQEWRGSAFYPHLLNSIKRKIRNYTTKRLCMQIFGSLFVQLNPSTTSAWKQN